ncbi:MAG: hypothetical protein ABIH99_01380, partial [Candidatus Micrarchaeota archaeon]
KEKLYPARCGPFVIYEKKDKQFGEELVYTDSKTKERYIIDTSIFQGRIGLIQVEYTWINGKPTLDIVEDSTKNTYIITIATDAKVILEQNFPRHNDYHNVNEFGIPIGKPRETPEARLLVQVDDASYVGLLSRGFFLGCIHDIIHLNSLPSERLGVLAYIPEAEGIMK